MLGATPIRVRLYLGIYAHVYIDVHIQIVYTAQNGCKYSWDISALLHFIDFAYLRLFCFCFFLFLKHIYSIFILWVHFSLVLRHLKKMLKTNFSASRVFIISLSMCEHPTRKNFHRWVSCGKTVISVSRSFDHLILEGLYARKIGHRCI